MVARQAVVCRGDVFVVALDPTIGREIKKARPCVVLSPDELNRHLDTIIVAPMTTTPTRTESLAVFRNETDSWCWIN